MGNKNGKIDDREDDNLESGLNWECQFEIPFAIATWESWWDV